MINKCNTIFELLFFQDFTRSYLSWYIRQFLFFSLGKWIRILNVHCSRYIILCQNNASCSGTLFPMELSFWFDIWTVSSEPMGFLSVSLLKDRTPVVTQVCSFQIRAINIVWYKISLRVSILRPAVLIYLYELDTRQNIKISSLTKFFLRLLAWFI